MGTAVAHSIIAWQSCLKGLNKLEAVPDRLEADLKDAWEVLAEPIQTVMRRYGVESAYEKLKQLTRGRAIDRDAIENFIQALDIPDQAKQSLLALSPTSYSGNAEQQALMIVANVKQVIN